MKKSRVIFAIVRQLSYDIDHQLETRMIKFVHLCSNHSNHVVGQSYPLSYIVLSLCLHQTTNTCHTGRIFLMVFGIKI